jgi:bis(5'-nucleosyl)-tetraphosphatase (symmetrical)
MATYAVGDVQGCYEQLLCLLEQVNFDSSRDYLWFVGDLVNRGPQSLEVLRLARMLGDHAQIVLGNHDLHLLAVASGAREARAKDTLQAVLDAPDRDQLLDWLRSQPLFHTHSELGYAMVHAGIPPGWSLNKTRKRAREVEQVLQSPWYRDFLDAMYGDEPLRWSKKLKGMERLRVITNYLTRMRFVTADGTLDLEESSSRESKREGFLPWFQHPNAHLQNHKILFGHWSALEGQVDKPAFDVYPLDTGCTWGDKLSLIRLEDGKLFQCKCN